MSQFDKDSHPMNYPGALVARFQFLRIPHGDGLDMNEPSYNERIYNHLSSYSVKNIEDIVALEENQTLRDNIFVIPFLYARYGVAPNEDVKEFLRSIMMNYSDEENKFIRYFIENFDEIIDQRIPDSPAIKYESNLGQVLLGLFVLGGIVGFIGFVIIKILEWFL